MSRVFQDSFKGVSRKIERVFQGRFQLVSRVFERSSKGISSEFMGSFKNFLRKFQGYIVSSVFQENFYISLQFSSRMDLIAEGGLV